VISFTNIIWKVSFANWLKVNTDGATRGYPSLASCADIFRGSRGKYIGSFSTFLLVQISIYVEFMGASKL